MRAHGLILLALVTVASAGWAAPGDGHPARRVAAGDGHPVARRVAAGGGISVRVGPGWHVIRWQLTRVISPAQRLVVTSFPLARGPRRDTCDPMAAIRRLPATGGFLFLWEYSGPTRLHRRQLAEFRPRPRRFRLTAGSYGTYGGTASGPRMTTILFRQAGRAFQAQLYLGQAASAQTAQRLAAVLDSLRVIGPAPPVVLPRH